MKGLVHIYTGDGKGKTTAALGLALRFAGSGGKVLYTQFLKNDTSSELSILSELEQITFLPSGKSFGFTFQMTEEVRQKAAAHYTAYFKKICQEIYNKDYGLLVLDEILAADNQQFVPHEPLLSFLSQKPDSLEVVLTGRNPSDDLMEMADYISEIQKIKHPFDQGISARKGIEL